MVLMWYQLRSDSKPPPVGLVQIGYCRERWEASVLRDSFGSRIGDCPRQPKDSQSTDCARIRARQSDADWRLPVLVAEENEIGSAPHAKLAKNIGDVELHGAFGDI